MSKPIYSVPICVNFSISKNTETDVFIEDGEELTDSVAKREFMRSAHYEHLKKILKAAGFYIDDFEVILD